MNFAFILILALFPLLGLSQEEGSPGADSTVQDEKVLEELTESREERQKTVGRIAEVTEKAHETINPQEALKKLGFDGINAGALMNSEALAIIEKTLESSNLKSVSPEVVREQILKNVEGTLLEGFIRSSPNLQNFLVDVMRDEKALLGMIRIFKDKERLKIYLYWWIGIMFTAYYTRKLFVSKYWAGPFRSLARLVFSIAVSVITFSTFALIFKPELKPLIAIATKYF